MQQASWIALIDAAADLCGGTSALARRLKISPNSLSDSKAGRRPLPAEKIAELAEMLGVNPAEAWELCHRAQLDRRNPFRRAVAAIVVAAATLPGLAPKDAAASIDAARYTDTPRGGLCIMLNDSLIILLDRQSIDAPAPGGRANPRH